MVNHVHYELTFECRRKENKTRLSLPNCYITTAVENGKHITDLQDKFLEIEVLQLIPAFFIVNNLTFRKKTPDCQYLPLLLPTDQSQRSLTVQGVIVRL